MNINLNKLKSVLKNECSDYIFNAPDKNIINKVSTDSRTVTSGTLFVALKGKFTDGHNYLDQVFKNGASAALVSEKWYETNRNFKKGNILVVNSPLKALQIIALQKRNNFKGKVIGITGSNGKTIVKNALNAIMSTTYKCSSSIGSYNSQLGVPLALLNMDDEADFWIVEAGISETGEMEVLQKIIRPHFGILTNIGTAHISGFGTRKKIAEEKLKLFKDISDDSWILIPENEPLLGNSDLYLTSESKTFGGKNIPYVTGFTFFDGKMLMHTVFPNEEKIIIKLNTPSPDIAGDLKLAAIAAWMLGCDKSVIKKELSNYSTEHTRMEIWRSPRGITVINDTCSSDPISMEAALKTMNLLQGAGKKYFIFGGMEIPDGNVVSEYAFLKEASKIYNLDKIFISSDNSELIKLIKNKEKPDTTKFMEYTDAKALSLLLEKNLKNGDIILFKGSRNTGISETAATFYETMAPNRLIVDLNAIKENINIIKQKLPPETKVLAMLKALGYGSDSNRMAKELELSGIDCFGVSTPDEGITIKRSGIGLPVLVMIVSPEETDKIMKYGLIPVISNSTLLNAFAELSIKKPIKAHLKIDTGMGRMGFRLKELPSVLKKLKTIKSLKITGLMTHFCCADDKKEDDFTKKQIKTFKQALNLLKNEGFADITAHVAATAGAIRFPENTFDMIRIGIGLYGLYSSDDIQEEISLNPAISLISKIVDIKYFDKGDRIGYGGTFTVPEDNYPIGIIPLGYHDGIPWNLSNKGHVMILGKKTPIIGRISMDSMTVDLSGFTEISKNTDVLIFGSHNGFELRPEETAKQAGTMVYELISGIGPRVQRIFRNT